uniref:Uncharacterized protein n=1 Tax=Siphoviridae sp. ctBLh2 TaxID=2827803 RepID=A0A8S5S438_9CAUD|nr:MAG TPA: hypothetical protein [Siphoviridae sp. ctBLh2]
MHETNFFPIFRTANVPLPVEVPGKDATEAKQHS